MTIKYIYDGDLFESKADALVNTVNCVGVMGKGIALSFKNRYKEMFEDYKNKCEEKQVEIGKIDIYKASDKYIINFPTKKDWRRNSKLIYIKKGLRNLLEIIPNQDIKSIAFPQLGCSNGRLSWEIVKETMEEYLNKLNINVEIYVNTRNSLFNYIENRFDLMKIEDLNYLKRTIQDNFQTKPIIIHFIGPIFSGKSKIIEEFNLIAFNLKQISDQDPYDYIDRYYNDSIFKERFIKGFKIRLENYLNNLDKNELKNYLVIESTGIFEEINQIIDKYHVYRIWVEKKIHNLFDYSFINKKIAIIKEINKRLLAKKKKKLIKINNTYIFSKRKFQHSVPPIIKFILKIEEYTKEIYD